MNRPGNAPNERVGSTKTPVGYDSPAQFHARCGAIRGGTHI